MKQQLLLLKDVRGLGRSGDVVTAKPGFIRNYLLPQKVALIATKNTLKMQVRLQEEREKLSAIDRKEAQELADKLEGLVLTTETKVDTSGKMYGSVTALEIARMLQDNGFELERKNIVLSSPLKTLGVHTIELKLKEGVPGYIKLEIQPEGGPIAAPLPQEPTAEESEAQEEIPESEGPQ